MGKVDKLTEFRTNGTAKMILELTKKISVDSLISDIFVYTDNPIAQKLIKLYEARLITACINPHKFEKELHSFYKNTTSFIVKNNLQREFCSFFYFVFSSIMTKEELKNIDSLNCYMNILLQQYTYFVDPPHLVNGLTTEGEWIVGTEAYPNIDIAFFEASNNLKHTSLPELRTSFLKHGYNINSVDDIFAIQHNDQLLSNMMLIMSNLVNEMTPKIVSKDFFPLAHGISVPQRKNPTRVYKELLKEKIYFLPSKGVRGIYRRALEIKEIYFQEIFIHNRIILLYKITSIDKKELSGFYDTKLEFFYSPWLMTDAGKIYHNNIENFVLESYCYLTTDLENKEEQLGLKTRFLINANYVDSLNKGIVFLNFEYEKNNATTDTNKTPNFIPFDKNKYKQSMRQINPFVRRLPNGAKASEEAIQLAREYNYIIQTGETFVRPYKKKVYTKGD